MLLGFLATAPNDAGNKIVGEANARQQQEKQ